ncbi:MAG: SDR family NAD(P)-dependent oxidoreductase [Steroidobacteraceae bacterium]
MVRRRSRSACAGALPGHIVNTSSIQGLFASAGFAAYNAAKFGIVGLSETLRLELAPHASACRCCARGPTRTGIMANSAKLAPHLAQLKGPPRVGYTIYQTPAQVAAAVLDAVRANRLYVLSHGGYSELLAARAAAIAASLPPESAAALANVREVDAEVLRMYAAAGGTAPAATSGAAGSTRAAPRRP